MWDRELFGEGVVSHQGKRIEDPAGDHVSHGDDGREPGGLESQMLHPAGCIDDTGDGDMSHRGQLFLHACTWVECAVCDGDKSQVFFCAQGSVDGHVEPMGVLPGDLSHSRFQVQCMDGVLESAIDLSMYQWASR